jgi:hypothetical protein
MSFGSLDSDVQAPRYLPGLQTLVVMQQEHFATFPRKLDAHDETHERPLMLQSDLICGQGLLENLLLTRAASTRDSSARFPTQKVAPRLMGLAQNVAFKGFNRNARRFRQELSASALNEIRAVRWVNVISSQDCLQLFQLLEKLPR